MKVVCYLYTECSRYCPKLHDGIYYDNLSKHVSMNISLKRLSLYSMYFYTFLRVLFACYWLLRVKLVFLILKV